MSNSSGPEGEVSGSIVLDGAVEEALGRLLGHVGRKLQVLLGTPAAGAVARLMAPGELVPREAG